MKWSKPKLVVLYKGTPQETLLDYCKNAVPLEVSAMPAQDLNACQKIDPANCADCDDLEPS